LEAFPGFFLSQLGPRFLFAMYKAFLMNSASIIFVCETSHSGVIGFVVGQTESGGGDRVHAVRYLPQFLLAVIVVVLKNPLFIIRRLFARFFNFGHSPNIPCGEVVLRSIGVCPKYQGRGVASILVSAFESVASDRGAKNVYLTTDEENNTRAQNFDQRCGYSFVSRFQQDGTRWMWLMKKSIQPNNLE
jgi:GNAT superfamily N-acetyltransferase